MKNTFKYILATIACLAACLSLASSAYAQDDGSTVKFDKKVSGPDANGVYTISLEAYVTGSVTVTTETAPADIVLVLDYSGSMERNFNGQQAQGTNQRIYHLRNAVKEFVDNVKVSDASITTTDQYGGHRIAFVLYGGNGIFNNTGLNTFIDVDNLTTGNSSSSNAGSVSYSGTNLIGYGTQSGGTPSDDAMEEANNLLAAQDYVTAAPNRTRVVVFFTDGIPGSGQGESWDSSRRQVANSCISYANTIKNAENYSATIYSVGLFDAQSSANETTTYLAYTSSDFKDKTSLPSSSSEWENVSGDKSVIVSSATALSNIFSSIATAAGGNYSASSASSVLVDIVASSFSIPEDTDLGEIKVYQVACTQASATAAISFSTTKEDITDEVSWTHEDNEVTVSGFDYGENWCGWDASADNNEGKAHGYKLVLEIPITVNEDAVGGPAVETNETGSKLIIKDSDGNIISENEFPKPVLKIPVNIWIQKQGLSGDDSAVFTLYRAEFVSGKAIEDYTDSDWENFTKVVVNAKNMDENGLVKISGLDPDYIYRIKEDAWAFGYTYQDGGILYTVGDNIKNPFTFVNVPNNVKVAEAVVRNVFKEKTTEDTTTTK